MSANYWASAQHLQWEDPTTDSNVSMYELYDNASLGKYVLPDKRLLNWYLQKRKPPINLHTRLYFAHDVEHRHRCLGIEVEPSTNCASNSYGVRPSLLQEE